MEEFEKLSEQEVNELNMDTLREESYKWPAAQQQAVFKELEKHGMTSCEAWEQVDILNRQFPDYSLKEMLEELNKDPEEQEFQRRVEEWYDQAPEDKLRQTVLEMMYKNPSRKIWKWIEDNAPQETWERI